MTLEMSLAAKGFPGFLPENLRACARNVSTEVDHTQRQYHSQGSAQAVRMGRWKGIRNDAKANPNGPLELYDLEADPAEKMDVSGKHPDVVRRIVEIMHESHSPSHLQKWNF